MLRYAAFTDHGGGGNPAGVVLDAAGLDVAARLAIAARVDYSEPRSPRRRAGPGSTGPVLQPPGGGGLLRSRHDRGRGRDRRTRRPGAAAFRHHGRPVAVRTSPGPAGLTATLTSVPTRTRPVQAGELEAALTALRWRGEDLDPRYPAHIAYAGNDHLILTVRDRALLAALDYDYPALDKLMAGQGWTTVHLVQAQNPVVFHARDPFPSRRRRRRPRHRGRGRRFGGYLRALALLDLPARVTILQGQDMGRPSRLLVDLAAGDYRFRVTGTADPIPAG